MEKLTTMKIAYEDGTYSKQIPIGALAQNIEWDEQHSLLDVIGTINIDRKGSIQDQLNAKVNTSDLNRYLRDAINQQVSDWLDENISKVGQGSIIIDGGLAQPGQAAEAKATGDRIAQVENDLGLQIETNASDIDSLKHSILLHTLALTNKIDDAYVEDGYLYMTSDGAVVVGPLGPFNGGGSGGGGDQNAAVLTLTNTSGWLAKTISYGTACPISINWMSLQDQLPTGPGMLTIIVNGSTKTVRTVQQGDVTIDVSPYLSTGANTIKIKVTDIYDNNRQINYNVTLMALTLSSTFDTSTVFTGSIQFPFIPTGNVSKIVHFEVDGTEIGTLTTSVSGRQVNYLIDAQSHGAHSLRVYFQAQVQGQSVLSNELYYEMICIESGNNTPIIASDYNTLTVAQYGSIPINYYVYNPLGLTADIQLKAGAVVLSELTVDRTMQTWTYRASQVGELVLSIVCGNTTKSWTLTIVESEMNAKAETEDLALYLTSQGRSNNEAEPATWTYNDIAASFANFNWSSDGWVLDNDQNVCLRITGDARVLIPYQMFASNLGATGKTIEFEFETRDVRNYDTIIISCFEGGKGIKITPQSAVFQSQQSALDMQYKQNEHVRISFVIEKRNQDRLILCYINGIISAVVQYPDNDSFIQANPVAISIGSSDCTTDIYNIRVYDNNLTRYQILDNWIADTQNIDQMLARFRHNNVFDEYGQIVIDQLPSDLPYMTITCPQLPQYKGDKKTVSIKYVDPLVPNNSFTANNVQLDVQGTSSQFYARKNYKAKFKKGFYIGEVYSDNYQLRSNSIPTNCFCFKADVASSEGANNVELVRLYEMACPYKTPAQQEDSRIRQGIDGFPMVIFWDNGTEIVFIGKYNFNNDKSTSEVFGLEDGDESWETLSNDGNRVIWKSADYSGNDWLNDFEARYPDTDPPYTNNAQLAEFAAFLASTDRDAATGNALNQSVTYDGVTYTSDTADYRLAKFKAEIGNYTELESTMFYYLFTELFLMVDSRAKNSFPSFIGSEVSA